MIAGVAAFVLLKPTLLALPSEDSLYALAFRPDNAELLGLVAGLARAERMREVGRRSALIAAASAGVAVAVFAGSRWLRDPPSSLAADADTRTRPPLVVQNGREEPSREAPWPSARRRPVRHRHQLLWLEREARLFARLTYGGAPSRS